MHHNGKIHVYSQSEYKNSKLSYFMTSRVPTTTPSRPLDDVCVFKAPPSPVVFVVVPAIENKDITCTHTQLIVVVHETKMSHSALAPP